MKTSWIVDLEATMIMDRIPRFRGASARVLVSFSALVAIAVLVGSCTSGKDGEKKGQAFKSPEEAVAALAAALRADDTQAVERILGTASSELVASGDPVSDAAERRRFVELFDARSRIDLEAPERAVLHIGDLDWPFPIPMVNAEGGWVFDTDEGIEEMINRRVGRNELAAIQVCLAVVDAQKEYFSVDRDGDGRQAYADRFPSSPGKKDGLYWKTAEGEPPSPLGLLAAQAFAEGYSQSKEREGPTPYHGYCYRILKAQGSHAGGGARSYIEDGAMVGGFALVAYPAEYGSSGIMTFIVSQDGIVFEKDLGEETVKIATEMKEYDPDSTWSTVDPVEVPDADSEGPQEKAKP